jgi:hypothetical protein
MKTERKVTKRDNKGKILEYVFLVDGKEVPQGFKYCSQCTNILSIESFSSKGGVCKKCANEKSRAYYNKAKTSPEWLNKRNNKVAKHGLEKKQKAIDYLGGECVDCKGVFPTSVYDFHHLDPSEKEFNLGNILRRKDFEFVEKELSKCVLLCANCHRIRHFEGGEK